MAEIDPPYVFLRGQRGIVAEVLFPKKAAYQGEIFDALQHGLDGQEVKDYLSDSETIQSLIVEMKDYPQLFDPDQYKRTTSWTAPVIMLEQARKRIDAYQSRFYGWSMYEVDGVFLNPKTGRIDEERTQVIRLVFRLDSIYQDEARARGCYDVLEALTRWVMAEHMRLDHLLPWSDEEKVRFLQLHGISWPEHKRRFIEEFYERITKEAKKWIDDVGLFIFGYLVRKFWIKVRELKRREDEIWTVSYFNANLNIVKRIDNRC